MITNLVNGRWTHTDPDESRGIESECRVIRVTEIANVAIKNV